jgi:ATP-binding cassette subfamily B protein
LVGTNGAGKSSLMKMLLRNLVTYTGTITIDGQNIKEISINALRENVSIAMPKTTIFNESLLFNITCGKAIEEEKLSEIIKRCCLGFLLKQNSDPSMIILGKYGIKLSSGQEQLVGLARLIARNPKIVIYDEAFAQLDNETFTKIVPFLDQFNKNKTVFWIDHNLHNIEHANEIIVIDSGRIIEKGNHEELLGIANSTYKKMWLYQNQKKNLSTLLSSNNFLSQSQEKKSQNLHKNDVSMSYFLSPTYRTN